MNTPQTSPAENSLQASTRHIAVDSSFAEILEEDFGTPCAVILKALEGEPQKQAIKILSWAEQTGDPTYALLCWARRHGRGSYRVPREGPPGRSVDRGDRRRGYGGHWPAGCSLRGGVADADTLDRIGYAGWWRDDPNITAYAVTVRVRYSGESTTAEGWVKLDGERRAFRAEATTTDRGATYCLDGEPHWWPEVQWLDCWFEELWMEAASHARYDLDDSVDFDAHITNQQEVRG